ncbi:hypothetical protein [Pseudoduganella sp. R-43]|uniref:hypothetical protein n=1 Tax=unclassified Pseudoduganella TaxID=2637179 RepID=UPI003CEA2632
MRLRDQDIALQVKQQQIASALHRLRIKTAACQASARIVGSKAYVIGRELLGAEWKGCGHGIGEYKTSQGGSKESDDMHDKSYWFAG